MTEIKDKIVLATSHVTQHTSGTKKSDWKIRENITNRDLFTLPSRLTEAEVFNIMDNIKVYELQAFNAGIAYGKEVTTNVHKKVHREMSHKLNVALDENERLAGVLDKQTKGEIDGTN